MDEKFRRRGEAPEGRKVRPWVVGNAQIIKRAGFAANESRPLFSLRARSVERPAYGWSVGGNISVRKSMIRREAFMAVTCAGS